MKKILAFLLAALMVMGLFAGCTNGGDETSATPPASSTPNDEKNDDNQDDEIPPYERNAVVLPLTTDAVGFKLWIANATAFDGFGDYYDNFFFQNMELRTGVKMDFISPSTGTENETFQLMITSQDYPDFLQGVFTYYVGGMDKAIEDEVIIRLNELAEQYMPNYNYHRTRLPEIERLSLTDTGNLWGVQHIVDRPQGAFIGLGIRQDWLDDAGLATPGTMDELENVLSVFKDNYTLDSTGPLWLPMTGFSYGSSLNGSFNVVGTMVNQGFMNKDGVATYAPLEQGYKDYLMMLADWYQKGLVYRDFTSDAPVLPNTELVTNDKIGVYDYVYTFSSMYAISAADPAYHLVALTTPRVSADQSYSDIHVRQQQFYIRSGNSMGMTTNIPDDKLEIACRYWDYPFSDDGIILGNYGVEGETFEYDENNQPQYNEFALAMGNISYTQVKYAIHNGPTYCIWSRELAVLDADQQACESIWGVAGSEWIMPEVTLTDAEGREFTSIISDINTLVSENAPRFILGQKSFDEYDAFVAQINSMNVARAVELQQNALDRFNARG